MDSTSENRPLWEAVSRRDKRFDGVFFYAVTTTGIYCRPGCPSRQPKRSNVAFYPTTDAAEAAGFRPCKRCRPTCRAHVDTGVPIVQICRDLEAADETQTLARIASKFGWTAGHLQKTFKRALGVSPRQYADSVRFGRLREALSQGEDIGGALYAAGFSSSSRVYEHAPTKLGMTPAVYREKGAGQVIHYDIVACDVGAALMARTERGLCALRLGEPDELERSIQAEYEEATLINDADGLAPIRLGLSAYFERREPLSDIPLDVAMTAFQALVWDVLKKIPFGETATYSDVAEAIGRPRAYRAVAQACGANPVALVIPCHRVVGQGGLGGYRWGVERKVALLEHEGRELAK